MPVNFKHCTSDPETGRSILANVTHAGEDIIIVVTGPMLVVSSWLNPALPIGLGFRARS